MKVLVTADRGDRGAVLVSPLRAALHHVGGHDPRRLTEQTSVASPRVVGKDIAQALL
jgi:hypothetical protein